MLEGEKSQRYYKLNNNTSVTIKTEKIAENVYKNKIVLEHEHGTAEPLRFRSKRAIAELVEGIDLTDPQLELEVAGGQNDG